MKSFFLVLSLFCVVLHVNAQYFDDVLSYSVNSTPVNGVKIKTNMPFTTSSQMPSLLIEGYAYGSADPINLTLNYYIYAGAFLNAKVSTAGSHNPNITLANENGKVVIFMDSKIFFQRFHIRAYATGLSEVATWFQGWTAVDSLLSGSATAIYQVPYQNRFSGTLTAAGNVGIGNTAPSQKLVVNGNILIGLGNAVGMALGDSTTYDGKYLPNYGMEWVSDSWSPAGPTLWAGSYAGIKLFTNRQPRISINVDGNVGIGTTTPGSNKLAVEGTIGARKVQVKQTSWADFVFQSDYHLAPLQEVEHYINRNQHLPGIPSEAEVQKEGIDVGEMNKKLLQKIEELTLYLIRQQKEIDQLKLNNK